MTPLRLLGRPCSDMALVLKREIYRSRILDPSKAFEPREVWVEIRWDPLTGDVCRIFEDLGSPPVPDLKGLFKPALEGFCPFCPENLEKATPCFPPELFPEGRVRGNGVVAIPNLRPFDHFSAVVVLGKRHFVPLEELDLGLVLEGFLLAQRVLKEARKRLPGLFYLTVNWNFLPPSGGSLLHPHIHALGGPEPSNLLRRLEEAVISHYEKTGRSLFEELLEEERRRQERFLGEIRGVPWLLAFAPRGPCDCLCLFPGKADLEELGREDVEAFVEGLGRLLSFWRDKGFYSFNMVLYGSSRAPKGIFWVHGRAVIRRILNPWGTSDINAFHILQDQPVVGALPEALKEEMASYFGE